MVFDYDSLVIATGAEFVIPKIKGILVNAQIDNINELRSALMTKGLLLLRNYEDGIYIRNSIKISKSCVIVGAGLSRDRNGTRVSKKRNGSNYCRNDRPCSPKPIRKRYGRNSQGRIRR